MSIIRKHMNITEDLFRLDEDYSWAYSVTKSSEGGVGAKFYQYVLKGVPGIRVQVGSSPFVGDSVVRIIGKNRKAMQDAMRELKKEGLINSIKDEMSRIKRSF